jgi:hypothetical protein
MRPLPISSGLPRARHVDADAVAARIAEGDRAFVIGGGGRDHVHELGLVGRRHHHHVGQAAEIGEVEAPACVAPSAPTRPARSMAKRTGRFWIATSCTT